MIISLKNRNFLSKSPANQKTYEKIPGPGFYTPKLKQDYKKQSISPIILVKDARINNPSPLQYQTEKINKDLHKISPVIKLKQPQKIVVDNQVSPVSYTSEVIQSKYCNKFQSLNTCCHNLSFTNQTNERVSPQTYNTENTTNNSQKCNLKLSRSHEPLWTKDQQLSPGPFGYVPSSPKKLRNIVK